MLTDALVIAVHATQRARLERILLRSPRLLCDGEEAGHRLEERKDFLFQNSHLVINNHRYGLDTIQREFLSVIECVISRNCRATKFD